MSRPRSHIQREPLPMRIKGCLMKYIRLKAAVLGVGPNILIEDALEKLLDKTRNMEQMDSCRLIFSPVKIKRIPISVMINEDVTIKARLLAMKTDTLFAEVVEAAVLEAIHQDVEDMHAGKLESKVIEAALKEFLNLELQNMKIMLPKLTKHLEATDAKQ